MHIMFFLIVLFVPAESPTERVPCFYQCHCNNQIAPITGGGSSVEYTAHACLHNYTGAGAAVLLLGVVIIIVAVIAFYWLRKTRQ